MLKPIATCILALLAAALIGCSTMDASEQSPTATATELAPTQSPPAAEPPPSTGAEGNDVNAIAYSFNLPNAIGPDVSLDEFKGDKNVVVVFYRAFW